jgi:hypothetical protein
LIVCRPSGSSSDFRRWQEAKRKLGIVVRCDGVSNVTEDNLEQYEKTDSPRVETEEGTLKLVKLVHHEKARYLIV